MPREGRAALEPSQLAPSMAQHRLPTAPAGDPPSAIESAATLDLPFGEEAPGGSAEWTPDQARALAELTGVSPRRGEGNSGETLELLRRPGQAEASGALTPGANEQLGFLGPHESEGLHGTLGVSSPPGGPAPARDDFWLNVNADLIIHGGTEPGARLSLSGLPVEAREDGTFTCRFALPDGEFQVVLSATSARTGERREAQLNLSRRTRPGGLVGEHPTDPLLPLPPRASE
jgi:hypothetical protein